MTKRDYLRYFWDNRCAYCDSDTYKMTFDHVVPVSRGGTSDLNNLVLACQHCNQAKGARPLTEFLRDKPQRLAHVLLSLGEYDPQYALLIKKAKKGGVPHDRIPEAHTPSSTTPAPAHPARFHSLRRTGFGLLRRVLGIDCPHGAEPAAIERR